VPQIKRWEGDDKGGGALILCQSRRACVRGLCWLGNNRQDTFLEQIYRGEKGVEGGDEGDKPKFGNRRNAEDGEEGNWEQTERLRIVQTRKRGTIGGEIEGG